MAATITYASERAKITGAYKAFVGGTSTVNNAVFASGEAPASGDAGRFILWCRGGTTSTGPWQIRRITSSTATTVTIHDPWTAVPSVGDTFRISSNIDDILAAQPTAGTKTGTSSYAMNCDLELASAAFFGSADQAIEWTRSNNTTLFPFASNCALQLGQAWGGEGAAIETTNGSRWSIYKNSSGDAQLYTGTNARDESGPITNIYGSLVESGSASGYLFQRLAGPARYLGSVFDGIMGGRFYHEASEVVDCRFSGNNNLTPAWSLGATFTRSMDNLIFYRNLCALKTFSTFGGTLRNCRFTDSNTAIMRVDSGSSGGVVNFVDCTEFADGKINDSASATLNQYRSVNFTITDSAGAALSGVVVRVNDKNDTTQGAVQTSVGSGICGEILALRRQWVNVNPSVDYSPFRIRLRQYGKLWGSLQAAIADPIKQSYAMLVDGNVTQSSGTAAAHTGITLTDHGGSPVSWQSKSWGITVTCDTSVNPGLTVADVKHYLHYALSQDASIGGKASGLLWHNLLPMSGTETENGTYGATTKGVRVVDQSGNPFHGVTRMQADDGTYYVPPVSYTLTLTGLVAGSEVRAYNGTDPATATVITGTESSGTTFPISHSLGGVDGFIVIRKTDYKFLRIPITYPSADVSQPVSQVQDPWYLNP